MISRKSNKPITGCEPNLATIIIIGGYCLVVCLLHVLFVGWWKFLFCRKEWHVLDLGVATEDDINCHFARSGKLVENELHSMLHRFNRRKCVYWEIRQHPFFVGNDILIIRQGNFRRWVVV
ncbi:hypothetical protein AVT69_gp290 [Pseudomonas phage PhiPA3]|uniref:Uncharacterized protein 292 n=1 Tax=Pseudomonas phage PhiPA3 TaxID=998086 RepID=F8SJC8_BPPA3|nr:hypothetical protein AVT69_gp290 [Pseudomonas phage PhiPA3]AEH03715.1 hypothetical protein [Pseudomonas phage PhiPA3]